MCVGDEITEGYSMEPQPLAMRDDECQAGAQTRKATAVFQAFQGTRTTNNKKTLYLRGEE